MSSYKICASIVPTPRSMDFPTSRRLPVTENPSVLNNFDSITCLAAIAKNPNPSSPPTEDDERRSRPSNDETTTIDRPSSSSCTLLRGCCCCWQLLESHSTAVGCRDERVNDYLSLRGLIHYIACLYRPERKYPVHSIAQGTIADTYER